MDPVTYLQQVQQLSQMVQVMNSPLAFRPIATTSSAEETEALFRGELVNSRILNAKKAATFGVEMNGISIGGSALSYIRHLSDYEIDCGDIQGQGTVILGIGCGQPSTTSLNGRRIIVTENAVVITDRSKVKHTRAVESGEVVLKSSGRDVEKKLQVLLDRSLSRELLFESSVPLDRGIGAHARSTLFYIMHSLDADPTLLDNPLISANFEDLMLGVILSLPSNYSDELLSPGKKVIAPAAVARAEEYMESSAGLPITITDVLLHTGCSRKALFANFRKFRGYSPSEFLLNARLRLAHESLSTASDLDTVTSIAYASGFSHMGRFSRIYRERYGVRPSETLKQGALR
jgi:AraC-like DNA-binding protein